MAPVGLKYRYASADTSGGTSIRGEILVANESLTIGHAVALLAAGSRKQEEVVEAGVAGWGLARLVVERVRGWLADTNDDAVALLDQLEVDPESDDAVQALALGIDLLLSPTSRIGRDLRSLVDQASLDDILAPVLDGEPDPPTNPVPEASLQFFEPGTKLFPDDPPVETSNTDDTPSEKPASDKPATRDSSPENASPASSTGKRKRRRRAKPNRNRSAVRAGPSHRLFPLVEPPEPMDVEGDLFEAKREGNS